MKTFFRRIHLYLGLAAGLTIVLASLTGAILVFEKDLTMAANKSRYYVAPGSTALSPDSLKTLAAAAFPKAKVAGIKLYTDPARSSEVLLSTGMPPSKEDAKKEEPQAEKENRKKEDGKGQQGGTGKRAPGFTAFMNPYTGQVLEKYEYNKTFFFTVMALHRWLLGGNDSVGKIIMGSSALVFVFILITGIILWWPKTRRILLQRLKIKKDASWKRINHDLHIVLGFYTSIFLFIIAFTGLTMAFEWMTKGIEQVTGTSIRPAEPPKLVGATGAGSIGFSQALAAAKNIYPGAEWYQVSAPKEPNEPFVVSALPENRAHENATNAVYVDQYSGKVLGQLPFSERTAAGKIRSYMKPVHTGSIWGLPSKILSLVVALLGATFPVTGFIMWRNRTGKKNRKQAKKQAVEVAA